MHLLSRNKKEIIVDIVVQLVTIFVFTFCLCFVVARFKLICLSKRRRLLDQDFVKLNDF